MICEKHGENTGLHLIDGCCLMDWLAFQTSQRIEREKKGSVTCICVTWHLHLSMFSPADNPTFGHGKDKVHRMDDGFIEKHDKLK
jgi:hypothetical protein